MQPWAGWPFARVYLLTLAVAFVVVGLQVFLLHWRAAFHAKVMWAPVVVAPVVAAGAIAASITRAGPAGWSAAGVFVVGLVVGLVGTGLHLRGVARRIGGFTLRNFTAGPPFLLPLAFGALALTGLLAVVWRTP